MPSSTTEALRRTRALPAPVRYAATAAIVLAALLARLAADPILTVRSRADIHGRAAACEGAAHLLAEPELQGLPSGRTGRFRPNPYPTATRCCPPADLAVRSFA